jgi:hypothetical protein
MKYLSSRVIYSVLFYVLLIILIILAKPSIMFNSNGDIKLFGVGEEKTMFSLGVASIVLALVSFYIFCLIDLIFAQK